MKDVFGEAPDGGAVRRPTPQHLDTDALSAYLDGRLDPAGQAAARMHVAGCPDCRRELDELRTTVSLLRGLPQYRPRRSFALGPEYAKSAHAGRLARLLPFLPILRTTTAVVALLLAVVTGTDILIDDESAPATTTETTAVEEVGAAADAHEPTGRDALAGGAGDSNETGGTGNQEADFGAAEDSEPANVAANEAVGEDETADEAPMEEPAGGRPAAVDTTEPETGTNSGRSTSNSAVESDSEAPPAQAEGQVGAVDGDSSVNGGAASEGGGDGDGGDGGGGGDGVATDDAPPPAAGDQTGDQFAGDTSASDDTAAADGQLAPGPVATEGPTVTSTGEQRAAGRVNEGGLSGWQIAQIGLGVALVLLVVVLIAVQRLAAHVRRLDPGF